MTPTATGGLLAVHAHPDDETLATGGLLASWAADGRPVTLVTCTRGELGEVIPPELAHLEGDGEALAAHRERELAAATARLGVQDALFLDTVAVPHRPSTVYRDSGMAWAGTGRAVRPSHLPTDAFVAAPLDDAATRLARVLRERRPDVVVTYEPDGGYGHPDHVHAHAVAMRAVDLAASAGTPGLGDLPVHTVPAVLWAVVADDVLRGAYAALGDLPATGQAGAEQPALAPPDPTGPLPSVAVPAGEVDLTVDVRAVLFRLVAALGEHRTQVQSVALGTPVALVEDVSLVGCYALSNHVLAPLLDRESYRYAPGYPRADVAWPAVVAPVR